MMNQLKVSHPEIVGRIKVNQNQEMTPLPIQVNTRKRGNSAHTTQMKRIQTTKTKINEVPPSYLNGVITQVPRNQIEPKENKKETPLNQEKTSTRSYSYSPNRLQNSLQLNLLPPNQTNKKTLVLDLDETLVHSGFLPFSCPSDVIIKIELENEIHNIHVLVRPGVKEFLEKMADKYEIVIFTASLSKYADPLLDIIDKRGFCPFRLFREHCTLINSAFVKDLKRLGRNLKDIIIVDNSPISYALNTDNGLPILSWYEDRSDRELYKLTTVLEFLATVPDVKEYIKKMVVKNELVYDKAMNIINASRKEDFEQIEKPLTQIQMKPSTPNNLVFTKDKENIYLNNKRTDSVRNEQEKTSHNTQLMQDSLQPQQINIKIINNNITNFICNKDKEKEEDYDAIANANNANQNKRVNPNSTSSQFYSSNLIKSSMKGINSFRKGNPLINNNLQHQDIHSKHKKVDSMTSTLNTNHSNNFLNQMNATSKNSQINITGIDFMKNTKKKNNIKYSCLFNNNNNNNVTKSEKDSDTQPNQKRNKSLKNQSLKKFNSNNILHSTSTQEILGGLKRKSSRPGLNSSSNHIKSLSYNFDAKMNSVRPKSSKQIQQQTDPGKKKQIKDLRSELNEILQKRGLSKSSRANDLKGGFQYQNAPSSSTTSTINNNINSILNLYTNKICK